MTSSRLLIGLLVLATVLVDVVAWSYMAHWDLPEEDIFDGFAWYLGFIAILCGQNSLVALWVGVGTTSLPWKLFGLTLAIATWCHAISKVSYEIWEPALYCLCLFWTQALLVILFVLTLHVARFRIGRSASAEPQHCSGSRERSTQFSLRDLMSWTTAIALTLSAVNYTADLQFVVVDSSELPLWALDIALWNLMNAGFAISAVIVVLGKGRLRFAALGIIPAVVAIECCVHGMMLFPSVIIPAVLLQLILLFGSLGVVRMAGYRIVRRSG